MKETEKQRNCPYCHYKDEMVGGKNMVDLQNNPDNDIIQIFRGRIYTEVPEDLGPSNFTTSKLIKYCPMCGRKLGGNDGTSN